MAYLATKDKEYLSKMGHQFEEMITSCTFNGVSCRYVETIHASSCQKDWGGEIVRNYQNYLKKIRVMAEILLIISTHFSVVTFVTGVTRMFRPCQETHQRPFRKANSSYVAFDV